MRRLLLVKALTRRNTRVAVAVAAIVMGAAVVCALTSLYLDISIKMSEELRAFGANFFVGPPPSQTTGQRGIDRTRLAEAIRTLPAEKLVGVSPFLYGLVRLDLGNAVLAGVDFVGLRKNSPYWQVEGGWVAVDFDERNAMVGRRLAQSMELKPGDAVTIVNGDRSFQTKVTVKGIVESGEAEDDQIFVNLSLAHKLLGLDGRVDFAMASLVAQGAEADALAADMNRRLPEIDARPIRKIARSDGQILDKIEGLMALVALIIVIITTLCVNATLTAMVAERAPEIGLQKALGATDRVIVVQFLTETAVIAAVGVSVGLVLGFALAQVLGHAVFSSWVGLRVAVVPLTLGISLISALVAAVVPVRAAVAVVPARVLRGE
ncbi:MAG: FtsX-like permease family protein [Azospirillum sp.]|nr:FtsX-like permease family protein [Azospirillum sp.]